MQRLCALIRAEARGESGTLMTSIPRPASREAPASSFEQSIPLGGTISTIVTNLPSCTSLPRRERSAIGAGGVSVTIGVREVGVGAVFCASTARMADFMARMWFGVVPQQPPMNCAPALRNLRAKLAMYSGEHK